MIADSDSHSDSRILIVIVIVIVIVCYIGWLCLQNKVGLRITRAETYGIRSAG